MATEEEQRRVADAIKALPFRLRKVFLMRYVQRKAPAIIAAELGLSERQVDRRLTRALVACRRRLDP